MSEHKSGGLVDPDGPRTRVSCFIPNHDRDRRTFDLLENLGRALGYPDGILLGDINDVLAKAAGAIQAKDEILAELAKVTGSPEGTTAGDMLNKISEAGGDCFRVRLVEIRRQLGEITGLKDQGATITDMIEALKIPARPILSAPTMVAEADLATVPVDYRGTLGLKAASLVVALKRFTEENNVPRDLPSRVRKAGEELGELAEAVALFCAADTSPVREPARERNNVREEAADLITVGLDLLMIASPSSNTLDLFDYLIGNLERKAEKYRQGQNRPDREGRP